MAQLSEKKLAGAKLHFDKCHQCTVDACPQNHVCVYQRSGVSVFPKLLTYISDTHNHRLLLIPILNCICFVLIPCIAQLFRRFTIWVTESHCTMRKLKNGVKSGQLWQIISPPIFNENSPNLEGWCKNIQKIKKIIDFPNIFKKGFLKL